MLPDLAAVLTLIGLTAYVVLGGADFGAGFWDLTAGGAEASALTFEFARQSLAALVAKSYFLAIEASLQRSIARGVLGASDELLRLAQERFRIGVGDEQAVAEARANLGRRESRRGHPAPDTPQRDAAGPAIDAAAGSSEFAGDPGQVD